PAPARGPRAYAGHLLAAGARADHRLVPRAGPPHARAHAVAARGELDAGASRAVARAPRRMSEIPIARPSLGEAEARAAADAVRSGWVTQGPRVKAFEDAFAQAVGARHACAVSSCTVGLHLALLAVGVRPGDVVITVSHSFIATANAVRHAQAEPVFVDIERATLNMDPAALAACLERDFDKREGALWYRHAA